MKSNQQLERSIRRHKRAILLVNTRSRKGRLLYGEAKRQLRERGYSFIRTYAVKKPQHIERIIAKAIAQKPELLIVGSGDGTLSTVVDHLAYSDIVLGYLPLGTTNNFGRSLQIPTDLMAAIDIIEQGKVAAVDLGKVNDDYFGNMTSIGLSVGIAANVPAKLKRAVGRLAYALYAVKITLGHKPFRVEVHTADSSHYFYTHQFCIANGSMHAGQPIAADASVDNGTLVAYALGGKSRLSTLTATISHARSSKEIMRNKNLLTAKSFTVRTVPRQPLDIDGEVRYSGDGRLKFEVAAGALRVLVPQDF